MNNLTVKVLKVFEADNGDVFFEHQNVIQALGKGYKNLTKESDRELKKSANDIYESGAAIPCKTLYSSEYNALSYLTLENEFIANADVHVTQELNASQEFIYLKRVSEKTEFGKQLERLYKKKMRAK